MHVGHAHPVLVRIYGEVLGRALGQHRDPGGVAAQRDLLDLA